VSRGVEVTQDGYNLKKTEKFSARIAGVPAEI
jgi:hypothetical protein